METWSNCFMADDHVFIAGLPAIALEDGEVADLTCLFSVTHQITTIWRPQMKVVGKFGQVPEQEREGRDSGAGYASVFGADARAKATEKNLFEDSSVAESTLNEPRSTNSAGRMKVIDLQE